MSMRAAEKGRPSSRRRGCSTTQGRGKKSSSAAPLSRLKRDYRYHFVLKAESRERLNATLRALQQRLAEQKIPPRNVVVDVDALSLL